MSEEELEVIKVRYRYTDDPKEAKAWLEELDTYDTIGCDFEAAKKYTREEMQYYQDLASREPKNKEEYIESKIALSIVKATALDHPSHSVLTHFQAAWSEEESRVFILNNEEMRQIILEYLITTDVKQVWHNASYDFKHILYHTGKMPKNYEDSEIFARCLFNHTDKLASKTGLKYLAGDAYGDWAVSKDLFSLDNLYDEDMIRYAATDPCATLFIWNRMLENFQPEGDVYPDTTEDYTPWSQLPAPSPIGATYEEAHFYHYTAKWLVRDTVRLMLNGLPTCLSSVYDLERELELILEGVHERIGNNPIVAKLVRILQREKEEKRKNEIKAQFRSVESFEVTFDSKKAIHRCAYMEVFANRLGLDRPDDAQIEGLPKWSVKLIRTLSTKYPALKPLLAHEVTPNSPTAKQAMTLLATLKAEAHNGRVQAKIDDVSFDQTRFNPNSSKQVAALFRSIGEESEEFSQKTGDPSWDKAQITRVNKSSIDDDVVALTDALIDHSSAAIVKSTFISAFYTFSVEGNLYGNYRLLGAKTGRYTSNKPNLLNMPSTGTVFAKPVKRCFKAPNGFLVTAIDYAALNFGGPYQ